MFSMLYFPVVAALATRTSARHEVARDRFLNALAAGELSQARQMASRWAEEAGGSECDSPLVQLQADLQLALGVEVEAEEYYRRSQKLIRSSKLAIRTASCRNAAWQAFFRYRLGTALACFLRVTHERTDDPARTAEARFGIVCVLHELGRADEAAQALDALAAQVRDELHDCETAGHWHDLLVALRFDLATQRELRSAASLRDHVYWQSSLFSGRAAGRAARATPADSLSVDLLSMAALAIRVPVLRARCDYLRKLRLAANADRHAIGALNDHLRWAREQRFGDYQRTLRLEMALTMLAAGTAHRANALLEPLRLSGRDGANGHRQIEYLYCAATVRQADGRIQESVQLYSRYALVAMQCLREDSHARMPVTPRTASGAPQLDDVGVRLPARYRRAYVYLLDNLDRRDLSVREVAAEIGVTERALQRAFKNFLGLSPTELIRRQRMERIRDELSDASSSGANGVLGAASKWGVHNRSTFVDGYRKQFDEAPSATLER